ncbi:MAG TPA: translocation/assembly module TamB domain-containing protein, partial [Chitinophagaceae bacterium]|nr:translocation/assembly module TamB domain-containing protein [Chitinophagaceae bacterium]
GKSPAYSGSIKTENFLLGEFLGLTEVGSISGDAKIKGSGFTGDKLYAEVSGHLNQISLHNYNYQDLSVSGIFDKMKFDGELKINDPNLQGRLNGIITLEKEKPSFIFDASIAKANFKPLGLINQDLRFTGHVNTNFSGNNVDNFLGKARIDNAHLFNGEERLLFDSLSISSEFINNKKSLIIKSNELDASLNGTFSIADLPIAFQVFLSKYYPAYINIPKRVPQNQDFSFSIKTGNIGPYLNLLDNNIKILNNANIEGQLNLEKNQLDIDVNVTSFNYKNLGFTDIRLNSKGTLEKLNLTGIIGDVAINDSLHLPNSEISIQSANNLSEVSIKTSASKAVNAAELSALVETRKEGFKINFNPSALVFNEKKWIIEKNSELDLSKTELGTSELKLISGEQEITISTEPSSIGSSNDILVLLKKVTVEDFFPLFLKQPRIEGRISGEIRITDPYKNLDIEGQPIIEQARIEDDSLGILKTAINFNKKTGNIKFNVLSENTDHQFNIDGTFFTKDSLQNNMDIAIRLNNSSIHWLERYLGTIIGNIKGNATGDIRIVGKSLSPDLLGNVLIKNGAFKILYTQCPYTFNEAKISLQKGAIDFGTIILEDTLGKGHKARFSGVMYHNFFKDMAFQMNMSSDGILLLNTTSKDNNQFYGTAVGKVSRAFLRGPETDMRMSFTAEPTDSSHIIITSSNSREPGNVDFIVWRQYGKEIKESILTKQGTNLTLDMTLQATPLAKIDVVLDELTGDVVKAQGNGSMRIKVGTKESLTINGNYEIAQGEYLFNFQTFWKYGFQLTGGNISWTGDPYNAKININARYIAKDVNLSSLTSLTGSTINEKSNLYINAGLTNTLKSPFIKFGLELPEGSVYKNDPIVSTKLKTYENDNNEMNKQVASLLLFNTFISSEQNFVSGSRTTSFFAGTAGQVIFNFVANSLKSLLKKLFKDPNIDPYITLGNSQLNIQNNTLQDIQAAAKVGFTYRILNGRIQLKLGSNVDYSSNAAIFKTTGTNSNFLFNQDLSMEYLINNEGKLRLIIFNRGNFDIDRGRYARTGLGLTYTRDFDLLGELFTGDKKRKEKVKSPPEQ